MIRNMAVAALLVAAAVCALAVAQQRFVSAQAASCERPQEMCELRLSELKENGVIRVTEKSYDPWRVQLRRVDDTTIKLRACRGSGSAETCYEQQYVRSFGNQVSTVRETP